MSLLSKHLLPRMAFIVVESVNAIAVHPVTIGQSGLGPPLSVIDKSNVLLAQHSITQTEIENIARGIGRQQLAAFEGGVMFGWDSPAADPRSYDENGDALAFQRQQKAA